LPEPRTDPLARAIRTAAERVAPITLDEVLARPRLDLPDPVGRGDQTDDGDGAVEDPHDTGGTHMVIELEERRVGDHDVEVRTGPTRPWWAVAAAAAVVLALVGIGIGALADGDDERVDVAPVADDEGAAAADDGVDAVLDRFIAAVNDRDEAAMVEFMDGGFINGHLVDPGYLAAGDTWTRTGPCRPTSTEGEFACPVRREDDFHGAAGLSLELELAAVVGESGLLDKLMSRSADPYADYVAFRSAFRDWVEANHPDSAIRFYPGQPQGSADTADLPEGGSMPAALELVDDFVAQSDAYPVG